MSKWSLNFYQILKHFLCDNIFISIVATTMTWGTVVLFNLAVDEVYYYIIFFATLSSYSIHWYFTELTSTQNHLVANQFRSSFNNKNILLLLFIFSSIAFLYFLFLNQSLLVYLLPAVLATIIYSAPKFPIKQLKNLEGKALAKTFYLAGVWIYTTNIVPFLISKKAIDTEVIIYLITNFIFIYVICLLFDYRDQHKDQMKFILINTNKHFDKIIISLTIIFIFLMIVLQLLETSTSITTGLLVSYAFLFATISYSKKTQSDYWFYLVLDGLMALPSLLAILIQVLFNK